MVHILVNVNESLQTCSESHTSMFYDCIYESYCRLQNNEQETTLIYSMINEKPKYKEDMQLSEWFS